MWAVDAGQKIVERHRIPIPPAVGQAAVFLIQLNNRGCATATLVTGVDIAEKHRRVLRPGAFLIDYRRRTKCTAAYWCP